MQLMGGEEEEIPVWEVNKTVLSPFSLGLGWLGGDWHNEGESSPGLSDLHTTLLRKNSQMLSKITLFWVFLTTGWVSPNFDHHRGPDNTLMLYHDLFNLSLIGTYSVSRILP